VERDSIKALKWIKKSAENGFNEAQFQLGAMYLMGMGVIKNEKEGAKWLLKAAESGNNWAMYHIATCYYYGKGIEQDYLKAYAWAGLASYCNNKTADTIAALALNKSNNHEGAAAILSEYLSKYGCKNGKKSVQRK
jgi:uncharacterized protein